MQSNKVEKTILCFDFLWLNNKHHYIDSKRKRYTKRVSFEEVWSWMDFLLDYLYICLGDILFQQIIGILMGIHCAFFLANSYLFTYEFEFM